MTQGPIEPEIDAGREAAPAPATLDPDDFKNALSRWASTVTIVAVRDGGSVHGTTVTSFAPVAADPPTVVVSLGPSAQVLPFLEAGTVFAVSFLAEGQSALASRYADSFPVGPSPFPDDGAPVVEGSVVALLCRATDVVEADGGSRLVLARVTGVAEGTEAAPLLYWRRGYEKLAGG